MAAAYIPHSGSIVTRAQAKTLGLKRYFTGAPCPKGHVSERTTSSGACTECSRIQCRAAYLRNPEYHCARVKKWTQDNPDRKAETLANWRASNPDRIRQQRNEWSKRHPEKIREYAQKTYLKHHESRMERGRAAYHADPAAYAETVKAWRKKNPEKSSSYKRNYKARKRAAEGQHTGEDIDRIRKAQKDRCAYCRVKLSGAGHVDHIIALANGGSNWPTNLQILCESCNTSKGKKCPIDFARFQGRLL